MKPKNDPKIEEILDSLDGMKKASAPDFFYTRLKARMEKDHDVMSRKYQLKKPLVLRPVYAIIAILIVILVNAAVIFQGSDNNTESTIETDAYQSIAAEYRLNDSVIEEVYK